MQWRIRCLVSTYLFTQYIRYIFQGCGKHPKFGWVNFRQSKFSLETEKNRIAAINKLIILSTKELGNNEKVRGKLFESCLFDYVQ